MQNRFLRNEFLCANDEYCVILAFAQFYVNRSVCASSSLHARQTLTFAFDRLSPYFLLFRLRAFAKQPLCNHATRRADLTSKALPLPFTTSIVSCFTPLMKSVKRLCISSAEEKPYGESWQREFIEGCQLCSTRNDRLRRQGPSLYRIGMGRDLVTQRVISVEQGGLQT